MSSPKSERRRTDIAFRRPVSLAVADQLLGHVLETGDYIQTKRAGLWLLVPMPASLAHMLHHVGADAEDLEDDAGREPEETDDDQIDEADGDDEPDLEGLRLSVDNTP